MTIQKYQINLKKYVVVINLGMCLCRFAEQQALLTFKMILYVLKYYCNKFKLHLLYRCQIRHLLLNMSDFRP